MIHLILIPNDVLVVVIVVSVLMIATGIDVVVSRMVGIEGGVIVPSIVVEEVVEAEEEGMEQKIV